MANKLPWFTHDHNARHDDFIFRAEDKFGPFGYSAWFKLIEVFHEHGVGDFLSMTSSRLCSELRCTWPKLQVYLDFGQTMGKLSYKCNSGEVELQIPNLRKRLANLKTKITSTSSEDHLKTTIERERERERQTTVAPSPAGSEPPLIAFSVTGGSNKTWSFTAAALASLQAAFPALDILGEARKAFAWLQANPGRRKTARGMDKFLFGWMERTQNRGLATKALPATPASKAPRCPCGEEGKRPEVISRDGKRQVCASCRLHEDIAAGVA